MFEKTKLSAAMALVLASMGSQADTNDAQQAVARSTSLAKQQEKGEDKKAENSKKEDDTEVIEVTGIRGSLNKSMAIKQQSVQVVDSVVAEDIGKFPDNNLVEALQRVTGVQTTDRGGGEVSTVTIRGLTDVTTTVNGRRIFTSTGRQVAVADIPAALLKSVDVYKTRGAHQLSSGIAGQIDIHTQRPFDFEGSKFVVAARGVYSDQPDKTDPVISALASDRWSTNAGDFGALINLSYARTHYRDQNVTPGAVVPFRADNLERLFSGWPQGLDNGLPNAAGSTMDLTDGDGNVTEADVPYVLSRDAIFENDLNGKRERPAFNLSLQWAPNDSSQYLFEVFYNGYRNESFNSMLFSYVDWWGDLDPDAPITYYPGTNVVKSRIVGSPAVWSSGDYSKSKTDSYVYALGGDWDLTPALKVKSELVYQTSTYKTDFIALRANAVGVPNVAVDFNAGSGLPSWQFVEDDYSTQVDLTSLDWNLAQMYDNGGKDEGNSIAWTLDGDYLLDVGIFNRLKAGVRFERRGAKSKARGVDGDLSASNIALNDDITYVNPSFFDGEADVPSGWVVANGYTLHDQESYYRSLYGFDDSDLTLKKTFDVTEKDYAAYIETDFDTDLFGHRVDGEMGLRYTRASTDMTFYSYLSDTDPLLATPQDASNSNSKLLPSFIGRFYFTDNLMARFAYTQTLRRPEFSQLNPYITYTKDLTGNQVGTAAGGNPNLKPVESKNYDLSLEWYFGEGNALYGTYFRRDIEGFVYDSLRKVTYTMPGESDSYDYILSLPDNASNGKLEGVEIGTVYFPNYLPAWLDGLGIQASGTFLDSSQDVPQYDSTTGEKTGSISRDMFGVSKTSYSAALIYQHGPMDARLSYVWRDKWLNSYEAALFANPRGIYRRPEQSLDFQLSYNVTDNLMVTFDATNLTKEIYKAYYQDQDIYNFSNSLYSRTFALGVRYSL
ncbi:TonB-dependent receptor [Gallaecimonas mangrovi]|uniref:TonB-dependent receptor n=1 Tax=Gallaecimonas mangrovi TaxID=2291597 RepID=UPI000E20A603|nr:TonB-dependent receptor [Gallaecimonas mangrovi]